jgi:hypothetical protein
MAASQILGLFTSPEQYQANQMAQFRQQAANEVQLNPFQQAAIGMRQAGYQLGGGIGGAMGGQDPQLQIIARRQALAGQLDPSNPNSYMQVAKMAADAGDQEFAIAIADAGRSAMSEMALVQQRLRERQGAEPFEQLVRTGKYTPASLSVYKTSGNVADLELIEKPTKETPANIKEIGVAEGTRAPVYLDVNNDLQFTYQKGAEGKQVRVPYIGGVDRTTAKVSASASSAGETAFTKQLGELDAKKVATAIDTRDNAIGALNSLNRLNELNQQELISGTFASGRVGATNLISTLGLASGKDIDRLSASENYQKTAGDVILATLGGKLGAGFSNEDRKFIQSLVPQLENSPQARKQLVEFMVKKNNSIVEETTRLENYARDNKSLKGYVPKIPVINLGGGVNKPASQMTRQELLDEQARLLGNKKP